MKMFFECKCEIFYDFPEYKNYEFLLSDLNHVGSISFDYILHKITH